MSDASFKLSRADGSSAITIPPGRRPVALRRSWLFVPGMDEGRQAQALDSGADVLVADLEEFTAPADRPEARRRIATLLARCRARGIVGAVRINRLEDDGLADLRGVMPGRPDVIFLPHAESSEQIAALDRAISAAEATAGLPAGQVEIVPTLESAIGVLRVQAILAASPRVTACLLAAEDLSADLGAERGPDGVELQHLRARFHVDCTAAGRLGIDCPFNYRAEPAVQADLHWMRRIGLKAKCVVFAEQVAMVNAVLSPQPDDVVRAKRLIERFEQAYAGAPTDGVPVDPPDYNTARRLLRRAAAFAAWRADGSGAA